MKSLIITSLAALPLMAAGAVTPLWLRDAQISPDGTAIAFCYKGDIYKVPTAGGEAVRLTSQPSYEAVPIWSPDGKKIAFQSDRYGNFDIFIMDANGGEQKRLTLNSASETPTAFTPDGKYVYYSASIQAPAQSAMFPTAAMTEVYKVPVAGGAMTQVLGTPAQMISFVPGGNGKFLYQDTKGMENEWRKHHTSSVTRDIRLYDPATGMHDKLTDNPGEDRNPVAADANTYYYLAERDGKSMNVYSAKLSGDGQPVAVTNFKTHPVRFLSRSNGGTLCFTYDGELYTMADGGKPRKVAITLVDENPDETMKMSIGRPEEIAVSPDGKSVAFISRGEVFVTSADYKTTKQITHTPESESGLSWGHDSKSLYYASERDGKSAIYKATMGHEEDQNFPNATIIDEKPVFKADGHERMEPKMSPDGKKLAFVLDRRKLAVQDTGSGKVKVLDDGKLTPGYNGSITYTWSPDSKWIALEVVDRKHDPYSDIAIMNAEDGSYTNITATGYFDAAPRFTADGNAIIFQSDRYGMRNHASWGSMTDVMIAFLNQEAMDKFNLNKEDAELAKEAEKNAKKESDDDKDKKDKDSKDKKKDDADESKDINVELEGIADRVVRLTPFSSDISDAFVTDDNETLYFISTDRGEQNMLWKLNLVDGSLSMSKNISSGLRAFETSADGKTVFLLGREIQKFNPVSGTLTPVTYTGSMKIDAAKEREFMYDNMVREEQARFYDAKMHGVDWKALSDHYRKFLPHISNNYDFAEMASELLGELNVSHTGSGFRGNMAQLTESTGNLGLLYDLTYQGDGLKVAEVVKRSPFDKASSKVKPGVIVKKINGEEVTPANDYTMLLTDLAGKKTLVTLYDPATGSTWEEVVKPITGSAMNNLLYKRWVDARAADVDRWSNGRLGYVHIQSMSDPSFRTMYADVLGKYNDRDGIVIDIRRNGGGRMHEDIEILFSGQKYLTQVIRGEESCDMPSRRWNKPSIMVSCEACYSNAHGTPWVYQHQGLGKVVGMPIPGTMTSVNWVTMQDPTLYFGIPVIGYRTAEGYYLENHQLQPDVVVDNEPHTIVKGEDTQLRTAVEELLKDIDKKK